MTTEATAYLKPGWSSFWSTISGAIPGLIAGLTIIGVGAVIYAAVSYGWSKFRKKGGDGATVGWALIVGAALCTPVVIGPLILAAVDLGITLVVAILAKFGVH